MPKANCPQCSGAGVLPVDTEEWCRSCYGTGYNGKGFDKKLCSECKGNKRKVYREYRKCAKCMGYGYITY